MTDTLLPEEIIDWINGLNWGTHHLQWHAVRQWDTASAGMISWMQQQGWERASKQEGSTGNGLDFLVMHRAMLELLLAQFPQHAAIFHGWTTVPTDPDDPQDPQPENDFPRVFAQSIQTALLNLQNSLTAFPTDDALGLYMETRRRPTANNPFAQSTDPSTGVHNYIHGRFSDESSSVNMGDPEVNLGNVRFWRLHGWIDARWTAFRQAVASPLSDVDLRTLIDAEKLHLSAMHHGHPHVRALRVRRGIASRGATPLSIARPFSESPAKKFHRLMSSIRVPATKDELRDYVEMAIQIEFFTIPLYLTSWWSLKKGGLETQAHQRIIRGIVIQEMLHLGIVCNLFVGLGGTPRLNAQSPGGLAPTYPDLVPGLDLPDVAELRPFSVSQNELFLKIEKPQHPPIPPRVAARAAVPRLPTIGDFYDAILQGLAEVSPSIDTTRQHDIDVAGTSIMIADLDQAKKKIALIAEQGEGTTVTEGEVTLAHFYAFRQFELERMYEQQADKTWRLGGPLPWPTPDQIYAMAPVPAGGYQGISEVDEFDTEYRSVVDLMQQAWTVPGPTGLQALNDAIAQMYSLEDPAIRAMSRERPPSAGGGYYGPDFRLDVGVGVVRAGTMRAAATGGVKSTPTIPGFARIKQILDDAVQGQSIHAHGNFWRSITRDDFVVLRVIGQPLLAVNPDGSFDPNESNLVKALEGRFPFGRDMNPPVSGARFNRMPHGFPPVAQTQIDEIRAWIAAGCPADAVRRVPLVDSRRSKTLSDVDHISFWRDFDNWSMFQASQQVQQDINVMFGAAENWFEFARDPAHELAWMSALARPDVRSAVSRLEAGQRELMLQHYGRPLALEALLDGFQRFGADQLPSDPLRPIDPRHRMNGEIMWFYWTAMCDAAVRLSPTMASIPGEFWLEVGLAIILGLMNDGVMRNRFPVAGFVNGPGVQDAIRTYVTAIPANALQAEWRSRFIDSGL